ncbi:MAG TPA: PVC-type heme-binding CxxCH protein [Planctomycetota bacterium]|nr:PVC-type heme-binding CxxCH protein [Planctomycetota bacterium]
MKRLLFWTCAIALCLAPGAIPQDQKSHKDDERTLLAGIKAPPGFTVTLFAAPPDVGYPTCVAAAPGGELFVGMDENGAVDTKPNRGRIVRCIDTDGDGRADKFSVFAPNVDSPRGLVWDDRTLYVLHPPFLRAFHDDDGDGVAERSEILVQGLGFDLKVRGADHTTNGMTMGIDGWLYIAVGDYGFVKATAVDGKSLQLHGGGVVRVRPDGTELEIVSRGQRNIYDVAIDPTLNAFTRDNTNDGGGWDVRLSHVVAGANFGYPTLFKNFADEIIAPLDDSGGGAPCGSLYVQEPGLPEGFGDTLYTCEWGRNAIHRHPMDPAGASFRAKPQRTFVEIQRPTDLDIDALGRFYISSWKNGGVNYSGPNVGFVARVVPPGPAQPPPPLLKTASIEVLLAEIAGPSHVRRLHAQRELLRRPDKAASAPALEQLALAEGPIAARVAAIFTLKQILGPKSHATLLKLAATPQLREFALRALADRKTEIADVAPRPFLDALADANPRIRLQAMTGLVRLGSRESAATILPLTSDADPVVAHVAVQALISLDAVDVCLKALTPPALRVLQSLHEPAVVNGLIERLAVSSESETRKGILRALCRLYQREDDWDGRWWGTRPDTSGPYFKPVAWESSEKIRKVLVEALADAAALRPLLVELQRHRIVFVETVPLVLDLAAQDPTFHASAADLLSRISPLPAGSVALLEEIAAAPKEDPAFRARMLTVLCRANTSEATEAAIRVMTGWSKPPGQLTNVRDEFARDGRHSAEVATWAQRAKAVESPIRELALGVLLHMAHRREAPKETREVANRAIDQALSLPSVVDLLRAISWTRVDDYVHQVRSLQKDPRPEIQKAANQAAASLKLDSTQAGERILIKSLPYEQVLAEALKIKGDPKAGAEFFARQGCVACHTVSLTDPLKGPFLGDVAARYPRAELIESILKPNAKIAQGFATHWFETTQEDRYEGFIVRESGDEVEIRNILGVAIVLPLKSVTKRGKLETSIMPTGLVEPLTVSELASLLAYLESLKK